MGVGGNWMQLFFHLLGLNVLLQKFMLKLKPKIIELRCETLGDN